MLKLFIFIFFSFYSFFLSSKEIMCPSNNCELSPVASFVYKKLPNLKVEFDASESYLDNGTITNYGWIFDDGASVSSSSSIIEHTYSQKGVYKITLTVRGSNGLTETTEAEIKVGSDLISYNLNTSALERQLAAIDLISGSTFIQECPTPIGIFCGTNNFFVDLEASDDGTETVNKVYFADANPSSPNRLPSNLYSLKKPDGFFYSVLIVTFEVDEQTFSKWTLFECIPPISPLGSPTCVPAPDLGPIPSKALSYHL